ncbi:ribosomal protein L22/L17 [Geranomyces variabilis]|nr:ribosomal protein L22/L17 [Geranomyces variabilis]KAJ3141604.1 54S ribosomal protein L22, mitochondrial [Geranomyces variabilis]
MSAPALMTFGRATASARIGVGRLPPASVSLSSSHRPTIFLRAPAASRSATTDSTSTPPAKPKTSASVSSLFQTAAAEAAAATTSSDPSSSAPLLTSLPTSTGRTPAAKNWSGKLPTFSTGDFRVSPRKLLLLARMIRGLTLSEAEVQMKMSKKRPADRVRAMLHRAAASLEHNYAVDPKQYVVSQAWVGKGTYLKRIKIHGRARFGVMHRPAGHLKVVLEAKKMDVTAEEREFEKLVRMMRKHSLYVTMKQDAPLHAVYPPWSSKPWKYVTSPKWVSPDNALVKHR